MKTPDFKEVLRENGSKATPNRIALLETLWNELKPVTVAHLVKKLPQINEVTLYRALEPLVASKVVRQIDFRHGHVHYELNILREHHHHLVCTGCGKVEDVDCALQIPTKKSSFKVINDHALEFFGICNRCVV